MSIIRVYVRPIQLNDIPELPMIPIIEFDPIPDDNAGHVVDFDGFKTTPGKCFASDIEIPDTLTFVESGFGLKWVEEPGGRQMTAGDIVACLVRREPGYRLVIREDG